MAARPGLDRSRPMRGTVLPKRDPARRAPHPRLSRRLVTRFLITLAGLTFVFGLPASVAAHAEVLIASPAPGTGLAQAPAAVVIKFSEPLNAALSRIEILDSSSAHVGH